MRQSWECAVRAVWPAMAASLLASGLATASIAAVSERSATFAECVPKGPTTFDYLVLASIADSPQLHAMASFRSTASQRTESESCDKDEVGRSTNKRVL